MGKILGLDLGTNSIGWAVINAEFDNTGKVKKYISIDDCGVRIFPEGVEPDTIGKGDNEQSKNATRREKRQSRRHFYRKRLRKIKLLEVLIEQKMCPLNIKDLKKWKNWDRYAKSEARKFPGTKNFINWLKLNPYELREKALEKQLTLFEFGRILYHFIQRRGFLSNRKGKEESTIYTNGKPDENILSINETKEVIKSTTLGKYFHSIALKTGEPYRKIKDIFGKEIRVRGRYTLRDMYIEEFEKIWNFQANNLGLNQRKIKSKKIRELKGSLNGKKNKKKIEYLLNKYGKENVIIGVPDKKGKIKITSYENISLKKYLGGNINISYINENEKIIQFKSNESVLFWQRPLRSQKGLLANCRFENNIPVINSKDEFVMSKNGKIQTYSKKPCPVSHPEFELFRAYQFINNIAYGKNQKLTKEQKLLVLDLINNKDKNFDFKEIPKKLKLTYEKFNYDDKLKVSGNPTIKQLKSLFDKETWENHYEEIWHCFYFYEDNDKLYEKLIQDYSVKADYGKVKIVKLKEGYANVSLKAIRNILPFLQKDYQFDRAVILGGVKNAFGKRWNRFEQFHNNLEKEINLILNENNKQGEVIEKIKEHLSSPVFQYGFEKNDPYFTRLYHHSQEVEQKKKLEKLVPPVENLRNPIVQQGLNETRRLVNSLIKKYIETERDIFCFKRIHIEMGRDIRNNKKARQDMSIRIRGNEAKNNEARDRLAEFGLQPSRSNVQKYLMYKEIEEKAGKAQCPYTGKIVSVNDLLGKGNAIQIEHIIPYSISLDDSFANKTLCEANFNNKKGEKTPYEFHIENPDPKLWGVNNWEEIELRAFRILPFAKAKRFTSKKKYEKSDFIERQLNDSRYIAKKSVELLSHVCNDVRVMPGALTAELRHLWGLNNVLQPIQNLDKLKFEVDEDTSVPYYLIMDIQDEIISIYPRLNEKPRTETNEINIPGILNKNRFIEKYYKIDISNPDLPDGKYWAKLKLAQKVKLIPKFVEKPQTDKNSIVFRGKIEKGFFKNETRGNIKTNQKDGIYWAKFEILNKRFEQPDKDKHPKTNRNQVSLFGTVAQGIFRCYIYQCYTNVPDGKYWIIIDLNAENIEFIRAINPEPEFLTDEILITTTISEEGKMVADSDKDFVLDTDNPPGKYYAVLEIESKEPELFKIENKPPKIEKGQKLIEGNIWVDKYTGEIKFDPKKNRDDHRHHAIDAITIALTEQGFLQRLSTYNAQRKEKERGKLNSTENYPVPWDNFYNDVKEVASSILVSHKKNSKTLTKNKKGYSVRGQLHKENVFGRRQSPNQEEGYHRRTKITDLKNNKHILKVVDKTIQKLIINHLRDNCDVNITNPDGYDIPKDAFYKDGEWQIFLPNKNGEKVPVKKVRIKETIGNAMQLKSDLNQYVNPRNNHHVLIYKDLNDKLKENVVSFWTVVERKLQGDEIYKLPEDGKEVVTSLEINDMFLLRISEDEISNINWDSPNKEFLSKYLYRVQKISSMDYFFRYHLASSISKSEEEIRINSFNAWNSLNPIKIKVDELGNIILIKEC